MAKTKIEWCDYTVNPVKGKCPMACPYCYARRMYDRFKWNPEVQFDWSVANDLGKMKPGSRVFWGSTMELFGPWVDPEWMRLIMEAVKRHPDLTHIFLTKQPQNLAKFSPFPANCWVGVSVCNDKMLDIAVDKLEDVQAAIKFISFEPLLKKLTLSLDYAFYYSGISWAIIGAETKNGKLVVEHAPKTSWVREIVEAADQAGCAVFEKNNLAPILGGNLRQEFPKSEAK